MILIQKHHIAFITGKFIYDIKLITFSKDTLGYNL